MSWWVYLVNDDGTHVEVPRHAEGGTVAVSGSTQAELNITFNYSYFYYNEIDEDDGLRWIHGKTAEETVDVLKEAVETLGDTPHQDCESYWCPSPGRAGKALSILVDWARQHPDATWEVSG